MEQIAERFLGLIHDLEEISQSVSVDRAHSEFDEVTLQVFWQRWPELCDWAGALWQMLSEELASPAMQHDPELDEVGESG